jgi:hypothetical protein
MDDSERLTAVRGCKFVDEVVTDVPYVMDADYIAMIMAKYNIDFVVHGDDPCIVNGRDVYETAKALGEGCRCQVELEVELEYNFSDYVVHGDDPCIVNGRDVFETAKALGKHAATSSSC